MTAPRWLIILAVIGALLTLAGAWFLSNLLALFGVALMVPVTAIGCLAAIERSHDERKL
ncbi:hypothetical protein [Cryobacterium sp. PH31-O1]|uniref:hypothetical protein n=1 Tax=Cryobacterium sp. PH31-O1 TaxID=3046306 RepID=UPI0024BB0886|nr:hypothetical protein [Cryobacterium sp. PH31-O1]MDJ0337422.1 hypothetical protein [Cryobacterium sp. PH31-O1]